MLIPMKEDGVAYSDEETDFVQVKTCQQRPQNYSQHNRWWNSEY